MKPFLSCNHPVQVKTLKGNILAPCGHCVQCRVSRQKRTELLLSLETQQHKYTELINLTYNDDFLPWVDYSGILGYSENEQLDQYNRLVLPLHLGDRTITRWNPRSRRYMEVVDKSALDRHIISSFGCLFMYDSFRDMDTFKFSVAEKALSIYNKRIDEYYKRFPQRSRGIGRQAYHVAVLFPEDLQKFIDRLQKFVAKKFQAKFRYFAVGEYGTNSLRPHWHILLFHDSAELRRAFNEVYEYSNSTPRNPRECASEIYRASLWKYGDITTTVTDGNASSYLSSYLNSTASLPDVLKSFPQKVFKSIYLGDNRSKQQIASLLKSGDYERLITARLKGRNAVERSVPIPSSSYLRFHIGYSFDGIQSTSSKYSLLLATKRYLEDYRIRSGRKLNIYDDEEIYNSMLYIMRTADNVVYYTPLYHYVREFALPTYRLKSSVNPLKSLFYACRKLYKMSNYLGFSPWQYLNYFRKFESWLDYQNLVNHFRMLEIDANFAYQYYSTMDAALGIPNFALVRLTPLFLKQQSDANNIFTSSIKHRNVVETYKIDSI